jgi:FAD/FMN-containing dehydrogenase
MAELRIATTQGADTVLPDTAIEAFRTSVRGELLRPIDAGYETARKVWNGMIDRRPALIIRCAGVADVITAVQFARTHDLLVAVRGGGHNVAGHAVCDGGLMIDLSRMKGLRVDPVQRTAQAQPGLTLGEFDRETQLFGLATTGGVVSSTGIAGLTLGGGLGWLIGTCGLAVDNLLSVDLVTADGRVLRASQDENADLFWAVRGAGTNFGVVASLKYQLHPVGPTITGGLVAHPFERARDVLRFYRDVTASLPDECTVFAGLIHAPDGSGTKLAAIVVCHCGPPDAGAAATRPLKAFGSPAMDTVGPLTYCQLNAMLDDAYPKGALHYWKSNFLAQLSDAAIDTMIECFARCPSPMGQVLLEHLHGAATRVGISATAFPHRADGYNFLVLSQWMAPSYNEPCIAWARETYAAMQPFVGLGRYVNYLDHDEVGEPVAAAYGPNYRQLQELKAKYDPSNFFHMNQNIRPVS